MSLPTGRGEKRVGSWGRARKRNDAGKQLGMRKGGGNVARTISVLLSKNNAGYSSALVNRREHRVEKKACQYNILRLNGEMKRSRYSPMESR
jgi:hypothetical protein